LSSDKDDMGMKLSVTALTDVAVETSQIYAHNGEECGILVKFMEREGQDIVEFSWPQKKKCHSPFFHVLCTVPASLFRRRG
jgi:hypothetical protein